MLTFGGKDDSMAHIEPSLRLATPCILKSISNTKTKISDLNKQGKNYNMPMSVESKKQRLIDYDQI